jgi:hypothetical protein
MLRGARQGMRVCSMQAHTVPVETHLLASLLRHFRIPLSTEEAVNKYGYTIEAEKPKKPMVV